MTTSDIIIIGSGPGGYKAALHAAKAGLSVVVVERDHPGGTCLNCGCIPTKTLVRNAEVAETLRHADTFGFEPSEARVDFAKVMERKQQVIEQLRAAVGSLMQSPGITFVKGEAKFADAHTIDVDGALYTAKDIIIATGSSAKCPPVEGIELDGVVTSTEMLEVSSVPRRLCIIGAGVIGMEFASVFSSLGSEVYVIEFLKECLPVLDSDVAKRLRQTIAKRGVEFSMQSAVKSISRTTAEDGTPQLTVSYERKGKTLQAEADMVLVATGRKPNIEGLCLEAAGVEYSPRGIVTDDDFRTNVPGIYAIGDVNARCMLAHAATFQGIHAVNTILGKTDNIRFDIMPSAVFTMPEAASVGLSEDQCKAQGIECEVRKSFYRSNGKALAMNETEGLLKLIVDTTERKRILGCHAFGAHSSDMIQEVATLMNANAGLYELADIIHVHPTLSEILHSAS